MKKIEIYKFWIGSNKKRNELLIDADEFNRTSKHFKIKIGPTVSEHNYLYKNNEYYRRMFDENNVDELCNIYKFWISFKYKNFIYMDNNIEFKEDKLYELYKRCLKYNKNCFIFRSYRIIYSGFFININLASLMHNCYVSYSNNNEVNDYLTLTKFLRKNKLIKKCNSYNLDFAYFYNLDFLNFNSNDFETLKINPEKYFNKKENSKYWTKKIKYFNLTNFRDLIYLSLPIKLQKMLLKIIN